MGGDINRLSSLGAQQQGLAQRGLDIDYGNYVGSMNYPTSVIRNIGGIAQGLAPTLGSNVFQTVEDIPEAQAQPNKFMQLAGTGLQLYGLSQGRNNNSII